ncbi:MAG: aminotransferase class I/II-fold pyridoxal phosphate-dependent enzyme [Lachnospiraceae bacterium]|nr:aminotransferase class I/II-fold pyridoxal phosphate-dependent enzyme [Lachnospiraceae bacterium]
MKKLIEELTNLKNGDMYPFHMPGHKRQIKININPYDYDITEIGGFDNLHHAEGVLKDLQQRYANLYGADESYLLINGSSGGILSAIAAATEKEKEVLIARNSHKSVYHGAMLNRLKVHYLYPKTLPFGINGSIEVKDVEEAFKKHPGIKTVVITSPTYDGIISDVKGIAQVVHEHHGILIVDAAHGAHFGIHDIFPENNSVNYGDLVVLSLHKTLPSPTQSALLVYNRCAIPKSRVEFYLNVYETSSPSYVMMAAMEHCLSYIEKIEENKKRFLEYDNNLSAFYRETKNLKCLKVFGEENLGNSFGKDYTKILISTKNAENYGGEQLMVDLRNTYHLECEMAAVNYVTALSSFMDTKEGLDRLSRALKEIDSSLHYVNQQEIAPLTIYEPREKVKELYEIAGSEEQVVNLQEAAGKISMEFCYLYPPGIPIVTPGEKIPSDFQEQIENVKALSMEVEGLCDYSANTIKVLKTEHD